MTLDTINSSMLAPKGIRRRGAMCINQPPALPAFLGMAGLAITDELAGVRICMTLLTCFSESDKLRLGKFCSFRNLVAFDAFNRIMLSFERKRRITAVSVNEPSARPAMFGMAGFTVFFKLTVMWITVTFGTGGADAIEDKLLAITGIQLERMALLARRI